MPADMKTFKISKAGNMENTMTPLDNFQIITSGDDLCLITERSGANDLFVGDSLHFEKVASGITGQSMKVCETDVTIKQIVDGEDGKRYVYFDYIFIHPMVVSSFLKIMSGGTSEYKYKFYFSPEHCMVPGDFEKYEMYKDEDDKSYVYKLYIRRNDNILVFSDLALCYPQEFVKGETEEVESGYCCQSDFRVFNYETMERNSILAGKLTGSLMTLTPEEGDQAFLSTNPYFFTDKGGVIVLFDGVSVSKYSDYMGVGIVLDEDYDAKRMLQEYQVNELFVKKIKNTIVPNFIDLEKIKYAPAFISGNTEEKDYDTLLATGLTFNLHFRTRISGDTKYTFEDTWHFDDTMDTWNTNEIGDDGNFKQIGLADLFSDADFMNTSNLIGYLGFTDDDIYNQKNRVKQTFIRLLFYDTDNPLTQNLLYYSTVFFDSGELYGKFVKKKNELEDEVENYNQSNNPVVWSTKLDGGTQEPVTCQLNVNDEYDTTKSGEGFNLYLFRQDAPIENRPQYIYMKIEFNHAGYGRTVPMIYWKRKVDTDEPEELTIENYRENVYIKLRVSLTEEGYVYDFPDAVDSLNNDYGERNGILWKNDRLVLNLFEPMIKRDEFDDILNG